MVRSPSCDNVGMKKGPWTPEEDIALVSYIQEHGQGNWRLIPARTGLLRSSKSCRLRWTNYLRPGIKHGNFTAYEDRIIIHLQAVLGNRWAAIASYLPQRTDNDIKNYWNTHLKKTLSKLQTQIAGNSLTGNSIRQSSLSSDYYRRSKGQWETNLQQTDMNHAKAAFFEAINMQGPSSSLQDSGITSESLCMQRTPNSSYAITLENVSKLLEGWKKSSPKETKPPSMRNLLEEKQCQSSQHSAELPILSCGSEIEGLHDADNGSLAWPASVNCSPDYCDGGGSLNDVVFCQMDSYPNKSMDSDLPFSVLEEWLLQ